MPSSKRFPVEIITDEDISWFRRRPTLDEDRTPEYILKSIDKRVILKIFNYLLTPSHFESEQYFHLKGVCKRFKDIATSVEFWSTIPVKLSNSRLNFCSFQWVGQKKTEGTEGTCYQIKYLQTGEECALKKSTLFSDGKNEQGIAYYLVREIAALKSLSHPNIVELKWMYLHHGQLYMLFPYYKSSLAEVIRSPDEKTLNKIPSCHAIPIIKQLLSALNYCHSRGILHRNIKPKHIVIEYADSNMSLENVKVKLADFALVRMTTFPLEKLTNEVVSLWYRAPELILGERKYHASIDIWSVGCIFAEMLSGVALFRGSSAIDQLFQIFQQLGTPKPSQDWEELASLPEYKSQSFPTFPPKRWKSILPTVNSLDEKILQSSVVNNPKKRFAAKGILDMIDGEFMLLEAKSIPQYSKYTFFQGNKQLDIVENQSKFLIQKEIAFHETYGKAKVMDVNTSVAGLAASYLQRKCTNEPPSVLNATATAATKEISLQTLLSDADDEQSEKENSHHITGRKRSRSKKSSTTTTTPPNPTEPLKTLPVKAQEVEKTLQSLSQRFWAMEWIISVVYQIDRRLEGEFSQRTGVQAMILMDTYCQAKQLHAYWDTVPVTEEERNDLDDVSVVSTTPKSPEPTAAAASSSSIPIEGPVTRSKRMKLEGIVTTPEQCNHSTSTLFTPTTASSFSIPPDTRKLFYSHTTTHQVNGYLHTEYLMIAMACLHLSSKMEDVTVISLNLLFEYSHSLPTTLIEEVSDDETSENDSSLHRRDPRHARKKRRRSKLLPQHAIDRIDLFMIEEDVIKTVDYTLFIPTVKDFAGIFIEKAKRQLLSPQAPTVAASEEGEGEGVQGEDKKDEKVFATAMGRDTADKVYTTYYRHLILLLYPLVVHKDEYFPMSLFAILLTVGLEEGTLFAEINKVCSVTSNNKTNDSSPTMKEEQENMVDGMDQDGVVVDTRKIFTVGNEEKKDALLTLIRDKIVRYILCPETIPSSSSSTSTASAEAPTEASADETQQPPVHTVLPSSSKVSFHSLEDYFTLYALTDEKVITLYESLFRSIHFLADYKNYLEEYDDQYTPPCCAMIELLSRYVKLYGRSAEEPSMRLYFLARLFTLADRVGMDGSVVFRVSNQVLE